MAEKVWQPTSGSLHPAVEQFTIGKDPAYDTRLAPWDVLGSLAHARMLGEVGLLSPSEAGSLVGGLQALYPLALAGRLQLAAGVEDIHSEIELRLTAQLGEVGKRLHTGRSRNDQVLLDLSLYFRHALAQLVGEVDALFETLVGQAEKYQRYLLPGFTHFQPAMPSSFGLWFGAYAESLADDLDVLHSAYALANRNPLGSAAGYGSPFPIDRQRTTALLGFDRPHINVVKAQLTRGKLELRVAEALAALGATVARLAYDVCLYVSPSNGFLKLAPGFSTGSSIMPHKQNPDVFELLRAHGNQLASLPATVRHITGNLPSGYHRDYQLLKACLFPALDEALALLQTARLALENLEPADDLLAPAQHDLLFTVEAVAARVMAGEAFRTAYHAVATAVTEGRFVRPPRIPHTLLGGIDNPGFEGIREAFNQALARFPFVQVDQALAALLKTPGSPTL